ncbi:hypothetical protein ACW73Q_00325 [Faecalibacterium duncaniae]|nr:MAG TPA: hypothetical protein [Caudoviricetes sp.]
MLFDTLRKKNQAEQEEREWNANRPTDYVSRNKDAMDSLTGQIGTGFDWDTGSKAYQQYRAQAQANAATSAENAQANAAMLAGGYGSSYADSVAKQGQQQALSGIDNAVPGLRSQALSKYQNQQNDLLSALSGMANTEALDRSAYGSNFANYTAWQNFLANQSEQARNENDNYWNNLWNTVKNIGSAALTAYDGYKGCTYQEEQLALQKQAARQQTAQVAMNLADAGGIDLAKAMMQDAGMDPTLMDSYNGKQMTWEDKLKWIQSASGMTANGDQKGAQTILNILGMDPNSIATRDDVADWAFNDYVRKQSFTKALSGRSSGGSGSSGGSSRSSGGSSKNGSGWTNSQLRQIATDYRKMTDKDELKPTYRKILQDAGWLEEDGSTSSSQSGGNIGLIAPLANPNKWALPGGTTGGSTGKSTGMPYSNALSYAKGWKEQGMDANTIASRLMNLGASDDVIDRAMQNAGF